MPLQDPRDEWHTVRVVDHFCFRQHLCITFELLHCNLYELIRGQEFRGLGAPTMHRFAVQFLRSLTFLQSINIIHCDLKPENVLLKNQHSTNIKARSLTFMLAVLSFRLVGRQRSCNESNWLTWLSWRRT